MLEYKEKIDLMSSKGKRYSKELNNKSSNYFKAGNQYLSCSVSIAEEESRNISENVKWNVRNNFKKSIFYLNTQNLMGYKRNENRNVYIDEVEAEILRDIYKMYLDRIWSSTIAKILTKRGIKTIRGNDVWGTKGGTGILKNEKYAGAALLQKTLYHNFRSPNCSTNRNHLPKYYIEESHEPIVSLETFNLVQEKLNNKSKHQQKALENSLNGNHMTKYKGLCKCGQCGSYYRHKVNNGMSPYRRDILICNSNDSKKT